MADLKPGSWLGDAVEEWKKLPTWGKIGIGAGVVGVIAYAVYAHNQSASTTTSATGATSGSTLPATNDVSSQAPAGAYPGVQSGDSNVPVLPSGVNPLFDPQGGLIAFQQQAAGNPSASGSVSPPPSAVTPPTSTPPTNTGYAGLLGPNVAVNFKNNTYTNTQGQSVPIPIKSGDTLVQGSDNRVWYTQNGQQYLLTSGKGPPVQPQGNTPSGGGGESLPSYVRNLTHYQVHYGDNLNAVAMQLRIKGGLPAWMQHNGNPPLVHGLRLEIPR